MAYIISLAGPAKVGKTTTAKYIENYFKSKKLKVKTISFADCLYKIVSTLTGVSVKKLESQSYKETVWTEKTAPLPFLINWTPRQLMQKVGTECFRNIINENIWIQKVQQVSKKYDIIITPDCRYENELAIGDYKIELSRDGIQYANNHSSAKQLDENSFDAFVHLNSDINLEIECDKIYEQYKEKLNGREKRFI